MANIPTRFKRITTALDDDARARLCQSSGSEHSANSVTDLSDLVDSFFDGDDDDRGKSCVENEATDDHMEETQSFYSTDSDTKEMLADLIGTGDRTDDDSAKLSVRHEVELVCQNFENSLSERFKWHLMTVLLQRGFDADLCKSRWEKTGRHPAGEYEYVDVLISGNRYIVEVSFGAEFTIARPTKTYQSLLETIPKITVMKPNELKKVVMLMCAAMRDSLKTRDMVVSPWRKNSYMQRKWLGSYKRKTNPLPSMLKRGRVYRDGEFNGESFLGFECSPAVVGGKNYCRKEVGKMDVVGNLKALMSSGKS